MAAPRGFWRLGRVIRRIDETARAKTLILDVPDWPGRQAGKCGRTPDRAGRLSVTTQLLNRFGAGDEQVARTVERIEGGDVSPYLVDELTIGDQLELRGPIGGYFVWSTEIDAQTHSPRSPLHPLRSRCAWPVDRRRWWRWWPRPSTSWAIRRIASKQRDSDQPEVSDGRNSIEVGRQRSAEILREVLAYDLSAARGACASCAAIGLMGRHNLYMYPLSPGAVLRCKSCEGILMVFVHGGGHYRLGMQGLKWLEIQDTAEARVDV